MTYLFFGYIALAYFESFTMLQYLDNFIISILINICVLANCVYGCYNLINFYDPTIIDILNTNIINISNISNIYPISHWTSRGIIEIIKLTIIIISYICHYYWNHNILNYDTLVILFIEMYYDIFMSINVYKNF